jgi:hypothetical protein
MSEAADAGGTPANTGSTEGGTPEAKGQPAAADARSDDSGGTEEEQRRDAQLPPEYRKALQSEREARKAAERELKQLRGVEQQRVDAEKTEVQRQTERAQAAERRIATLEREALARQVASEAGIPDWWDRLTGDDVRALRADATRVREMLGQGKGALDGGMRGTRPLGREPTMDDLIRSKAGR